MTEPAMEGPIRPRQADVTDGYDLGAAAYEALWSPVIVPPAAALVPFLGLTGQCLVADVGAGTGALVSAIRSAAPGARIVALDASAEMLRVARTRVGAQLVLADALALPLPDRTADAVILAYVLFHLADPARALAEAARVLRPGGRAGTVTWARELESRAGAVWDQVLTEAGVPPAPPRRIDAGLDRPDAVEALLRSVGLRPVRIWTRRLRRLWDRSSFWELASGSGVNRIRLNHVDAATRAGVADWLKRALDRLAPRDFLWEGEVICAVAAKSAAAWQSGRSGDNDRAPDRAHGSSCQPGPAAVPTPRSPPPPRSPRLRMNRPGVSGGSGLTRALRTPRTGR